MFLFDPALIPLNALFLVAAVMVYAALSLTVNMKFVSMKMTKIIGAVIGGVFSVCYFIAVYNMSVTHNVPLSLMHFSLLSLFVFLAFIGAVAAKEITFHPLQIIGLVVFVGAVYFLLA